MSLFVKFTSSAVRDRNYNFKECYGMWMFVITVMKKNHYRMWTGNMSYLTKGNLAIVITSSLTLTCKRHNNINSLWPGDAIWWYRSGSKLAQVMASCLMAPTHYLKQCWRLINWDLWLSSKILHIPRLLCCLGMCIFLWSDRYKKNINQNILMKF